MADTDRKLLEFAAKAAGFGYGEWTKHGIVFAVSDAIWNPLTNDGDALRLAVKLHMTVRCYMGNTCAQISVPGQRYADADETDHVNPTDATRRAIVRAAAEIGATHE